MSSASAKIWRTHSHPEACLRLWVIWLYVLISISGSQFGHCYCCQCQLSRGVCKFHISLLNYCHFRHLHNLRGCPYVCRPRICPCRRLSFHHLYWNSWSRNDLVHRLSCRRHCIIPCRRLCPCLYPCLHKPLLESCPFRHLLTLPCPLPLPSPSLNPFPLPLSQQSLP